MEEITKDEYSRFKGLNWFSKIYKKDILIIGSGGIASWTNLLLARCGANLHIFDFDTVESHNISGQLFKTSDAGKYKVDAISGIISEFCNNETEVVVYPEKYTKDSVANPITIMGVDNMEARKIGFENWVQFLKDNPEEKENALFIDGRLSATVLQIFCIRGNDENAIFKYFTEYLFNDAEVADDDCTMKQTSHCAAMIASHIVAFLTNFLSPENYDVPFFYEYLIPLNYTNNENA